MTRRRQLAVGSAPCDDIDGLFCLLRDNLGKAHAFIRSGDSSPAPTWFPVVELRRAPPTLAEIWRDHVRQRLEEGHEGEDHPFAFGDANIRIAAEEWLERIRTGREPWNAEAIAGLKALLGVLNLRLGPRSDKPAGGRQ